VVSLGRNSLQHAFVETSVKQRLLSDYDKRVSSFAQQFQKQGWAALRNVRPVSYSFLCRRYKVCLRDTPQ
jgi:adenosine deaminase CECR1